MRLHLISPNIIEVAFRDGTLVLFFHDWPVAAHTPQGLAYRTTKQLPAGASSAIRVWLGQHPARGTYSMPQEWFEHLIEDRC
jgi:hypothetical protein